MLRSIPSFFFLFIAFSCSFSQNNESSCNPTIEEQEKSFYLKPLGDSLQLIKSGSINGTSWIKFLSSNHLLSSSKIIDCPTGKEIKPKYWEYDISYHAGRILIQSHKRLWAFHEGKKNWVGDLGVPAYSEEIYASNDSIRKTTPSIILHLPYYSTEALAKLNEEYEKYLRTKMPASNPLLLNRLLVAALNGDTLSKTRLLKYREQFPNSSMDDSIKENIQLLQDYEAWLAAGGKRIFLTTEDFPILK